MKQVMFARVSAEMNSYGLKGGNYSFMQAEKSFRKNLKKGGHIKAIFLLISEVQVKLKQYHLFLKRMNKKPRYSKAVLALFYKKYLT